VHAGTQDAVGLGDLRARQLLHCERGLQTPPPYGLDIAMTA
jgi:hypothetical protein